MGLTALRPFLSSGGTRRQMIGTALAGLILGLGGVTVGTSLVHASERNSLLGFFEDLFRGPAPQPAPPPRPARYATLPDARRLPRAVPHTPRVLFDHGRRRIAARRAKERTARVAAATGLSVCVRMCDGYLFPLGNLGRRADLPIHAAACAAACPGAPTRAYTLAAGETALDRAVGPDGQPYRMSALANVYRQRRVANCSCQAAPGEAPRIAEDATLRAGDVVATRDSARVVARARPGSLALIDYRRAELTPRQRDRIEAKVGTIRREAEARAFRRALRGGVVRVASAETGFRIPERAAGEGIRVVAPVPFVR